MITSEIRMHLEALANRTIPVLTALPQSQALINKPDKKMDRVDIKILKEADKLNRREYIDEVKHEGKGPSKRKGSITYKSYSIEFKKRLIASIRQELKGGKMSLPKLIREKAKTLRIHPKNINRWYHTKQIKKKEGGRKALYPEMEVRLANFILNNPTMRRKLILRQAKQIMEELEIPGREFFNFSKGWYERFRQRLNKCKIDGVKKEGEQIKYEVKLQDFQDKEQDDDDAKQEEDVIDQSEEESYDSDDSYNISDQVKLEEELEEEENEMKKTKSKPRVSSRNCSKKEASLFFDEDEDGLCSRNLSFMNLLEEQGSTLARQLGMI